VGKTPSEIREQITVDPYAGDGAVVTRDLGGGYTQTQLGPAAPQLAPDQLEQLLDLPDDERPPEERIHRVSGLSDDELAQLEEPDHLDRVGIFTAANKTQP
jgi:hypothetical protein